MTSLRHRRNWIMAKSVFKTALKSLFWAPTCVPRFENAPRCPVKDPLSICNQVERKFETHWNLLEALNKDLVAASQTLITGVKFRLRRMLGCVRSFRVVQVLKWPFFFHFFFSVYLPWKRSSLSCLCSWSAASHFRRSKRKYLYPWVLEEIVPIRQ